MIHSEHEMDSHPFLESEEDCGNKDGVEHQKKMKKLRSIKLSRSPSLKQSTRKEKSQFSLGMLSSASSFSSSSSDVSTPSSSSNSSPNYMKTTSSSKARNNHFQKSPASSKPLKTLTRMSSARLKKALVRKSVGGAETRKTVKQFKEMIGDSDEQELQSPVSSQNSVSGDRSNGCKIRDVSTYSKPKSLSLGQRSGIMLTRKSSFRPMRKLAKIATFKSNKYSMEISKFSESCVEKATCSSTLKGSKFPDHIKLQPGEGREYEKIALKKVCPYSYCSLHSHSHANVPPLKRFKSIRKRALKAQKTKKGENQPLSRAKQSSNKKEDTQASQMVNKKVSVAHEMASVDRQVSAAVENSNRSIPSVTDSGEASNTKSEDIYDASECNLKDSLTSSASNYEQMECQSEAREEIKGDLEVELGSLSRTDSNSSISLNITAKVQEINPKYIRMWHLVYKNVVNSNSSNVENELPLHGMEKETLMEVDNKLLGETNSRSYKVLSDVDQEGADINPDAAYKKLELCKNEAIKLVQEAFDKILLPEIQDQSPHNQDSGEKLLRRIQAEVGGSSIPISSSGTYSVGEDVVPDVKEAQTKAKNIIFVEDKKTMPLTEKRSNQQVPKRWGNLKKLILLKRFVKALEKVRKINPQKPQCLPLEPDQEGERLYLKRQTTEERKNSEEWMLDYALQQVISKLEPDQKKRVSLLVEAFETILPMPRIEACIKTKAVVPANPHQAHGGSDEIDKESKCQNGADTLLKKLSNRKDIVKESTDQAKNIIKVGHQSLTTFSDKNEANVEHLLEKSQQGEAVHETTNREWRVAETLACNLGKVEKEGTVINCLLESVDKCLPEVKDAILDSETSQKPEGTESTGYQEILVNGKLLKISERVISRLNSELYNGNLESSQTTLKNDSLISVTSEEFDTSKSFSSKDYEKSTPVKSFASEVDEKSTEINNVECSKSANELLEKTRAAIVYRDSIAQSDAGSIQEESVPPVAIKTVFETDEGNEIQREEKKNASMWFLIYKHMVSSIDAKDGSEPLVNEANKEERDFSVRKQNMGMEEMIANDPNVELQCIEAVKLVNEAIDEIPLPENSNSPYDQLSSANLITDQGLPEENSDKGSELFLSITNDFVKDASDKTSASCNIVSSPDEGSLKSMKVNSREEEKELNWGNKPNQQVQRNWSNLKKVILLKRFIKAVEKVKKFDPRQPRFLPLVEDEESEKVQLRHQDTRDRKNAEEWMLDYALQQAVARLTPARKRKVELLVQAFETVNPTIRK